MSALLSFQMLYATDMSIPREWGSEQLTLSIQSNSRHKKLYQELAI